MTARATPTVDEGSTMSVRTPLTRSGVELARDAMSFLETEHGLHVVEAYEHTAVEWGVTWAGDRHEVKVAQGPENYEIAVTVDGIDLRARILDRLAVMGVLTAAWHVRLSNLGRPTGARPADRVLTECAMLLREYAPILLS